MLTVVGWPTTTGDAGRGVHRRDSTDAARRCLWTGAGKSHPPNMRLPPPRRQQSGEHKHGILDRFIPPRSLQSNESRLSVLPDAHRTDGAPQSILEKDLKSERRFAYRRLLGTALFGERRCVRVLPLGLGAADGAEASLEHVEVDDRQDWPVRARRDPLVGAPELTVCMPELPKVPGSRGSRARMDQLMSWGACGVLAVAGRFGVYLWRRPVETNLPGTAGGSERSELLVSFEDDNNPMSLCWSPSPDRALLAIGTGRSSLVQMWDCDLKRELFSRRLPGPLASINAISWHPYEDIIAMGSYSGIVYVVTPSLSVLKFIRVFDREHGGVSAMSFSPDGLLLACGGMMGTALVWDWETGVVRGDEVDYRSPITSLSWHPWRSSVVALGTLAGQIALLNFSSRRTTTATYQGAKNQQVSVTALSFSERTAELVVAFSGKGVSQVAVLSDLTTVVDRIKAHQDSVNYICWSPDGAILATAGMDETLCVWNFLGAKTTKELRRRALQESREDRSGVRRQFGCIIR